jgi:hypothetical protein
MTNWIPDVNRFALAQPPQFFLSKLWEFDNSLVILPSRQSPVYRLAQRRKLNLPEKMVNEALFNESDTQLLASYSLVPVTSILGTVNWHDPYLFVELHNRAPHRQGGADKVNALLEDQDAKTELMKAAKQDELLTYLGKDAWGLYNKNIGVRSHMYSPRTKADIVKPRFGNSAAIRFR